MTSVGGSFLVGITSCSTSPRYIGLWTYTTPHPLKRYPLDSLESLRGLEGDLVLPGHGLLFYDLDGRIDELLWHHGLSIMHSTFDRRVG